MTSAVSADRRLRDGPGLAPAPRPASAQRPPASGSWQADAAPEPTLPDAARERFGNLAEDLRKAVRRVKRGKGPDDIHDLRVAARRALVTVEQFETVLPDGDRGVLSGELDRLTERLGEVRDLDVLLDRLADNGGGDVERLRRAWTRARRRAFRGLVREFRRSRYRRFTKALRRAAEAPSPSASDAEAVAEHPPRLLRDDAAARVLDAMADVLAFSIDPATADVEAIHAMRKQAKQLRDTLRGYEDVFGPEAGRLAARVSTVQDVAGDLHDADLAAARARRFLRRHRQVDPGEAAGIRAFASRQDERVAEQRVSLVGQVAGLRGGAFRLRIADLIRHGLA